MALWFEELKKEKDACYHKVRSRYKKWPSAYASGALVRCRKVGAKNWGNKSKKVKKSCDCVSKGGDNFKREKESGLHGWFSRRGGGQKAGFLVNLVKMIKKEQDRVAVKMLLKEQSKDVGRLVQRVKHIKGGKEHDMARHTKSRLRIKNS